MSAPNRRARRIAARRARLRTRAHNNDTPAPFQTWRIQTHTGDNIRAWTICASESEVWDHVARLRSGGARVWVRRVGGDGPMWSHPHGGLDNPAPGC